jgi:lipopolysaccharide exporter
MPETQRIHHRAKRGIHLLMLRQVVVQVVTFAGGIVLARVLEPVDFGVFGITTFVIFTLMRFGNLGLAASLIQRKEAITSHDLQVGFTMQQIIVSALVLGVWFAAPYMTVLYPKAPDQIVWLVRVLAFNLYLQGWLAMSKLQLERKLSYKRLAIIEVVQKLSYQVIAVVLAVLGYGIWSLIIAVLAQSSISTVLAFRLAPWRVRLAFDAKVARELLRFGLPFQMKQIISNTRGWITPTLVAALIGPEAVGFLTWAGGLGRKPMLAVQNVTRVSFTHFSRIQSDSKEVMRILTRYYSFLLPLCLFWFVLILTAGSSIVEVVYTAKWLPAMPVLILYSLSVNVDMFTRLVTRTLQGLGHVWYVMRIVAIQVIIQVLLSVVSVLTVGYVGIPVAEMVSLAVMLPWLFHRLGRGWLIHMARSLSWVVWPTFASATLASLTLLLPFSVEWHAVSASAVTIATFAGVFWMASPEWMREQVATAARSMRRRLFPEKKEGLNSG